ncbi:hypothetical protein AMPC_34120 [Anaeromyxobacter paludicola]|uniref:Tetratricopeptide repeat protein n=2 Tax=Anaeromyxobacter paludicola TaxID=2918171 RepID=A0ABN6NAR2_9BACT|nr:hypothetical protein AMPC_34120 [Anaeromyxobacter paludicola]
MLLVAGGATAPEVARARVDLGGTVENAELPTLDGGRAPLLAKKALANVLVFFRPDQEHSVSTLRQLVDCEKRFESKPVHWVAVVSDTYPPDEVRAVVKDAGVKMPVVRDVGDALYGKLGIRLHPVVGIVDAKQKLVAYEPFHKIDYCALVTARIQFVLGEIDAQQLQAVLAPPRATQGGDDQVARRHVKMGEMMLKSGNTASAEENARKALEKDPALASAHALLGGALAGQGKCAEAAKAFDEALKLEPQNAAATAGKQRCAAGAR